MKLVFLTGTLQQGGAERTIASLANAFSRSGHEVLIYILEKEKNIFYHLDPAVKIQYVDFKSIRFVSNYYIVKNLHTQLQKDHPEWVLTFDARTLVLVMLAHTKEQRVLYSERSNPLCFPVSKLWRTLRSIFIKRTDLNVFQTESVRNLFPTSVQKNSVVIPNAIFNECIYDLPYPAHRLPVIAAMGRLDCSIKGFDILLRAFAQIAKQIPDFKLRIYGHGKDEMLLKKLAEELGVSDRFEIIKGNENAIIEVSQARAFVLSSHYEGYPNALLEALACGVPCIAADCNYGPRDIICDGENGLLVPEGDENALAQAILHLVSDDEYAERLAEKAFEIRQSMSLSRIAALWEEVLLGGV